MKTESDKKAKKIRVVPSFSGKRLLKRYFTDRQIADFDLFEIMQLQQVLGVCRRYRHMSEAGRALFDVSRNKRSSVNDTDRLRKYLMRYDLTWEMVRT